MADASSNSDSEEFYDAEDATPRRNSRKQRESLPSKSSQNIAEIEPQAPEPSKVEEIKADTTSSSAENIAEDATRSKLEETQNRRKRVLELRQRLTTDEDQQTSGTSGAAGSPQGSTASSIDGVYLSNRGSIQSAPSTSHPFKYIEQDALSLHSLSSIGRGGLMLSQLRPDPVVPTVQAESSNTIGRMDPPPPPPPLQPLQEPDVIASTKAPAPPVAPPRRKKKNKSPANQDTPLAESAVGPISCDDEGPLPSPASAIASLAREFEQSLDLRAATKGQYVVKPQDTVSCRAEPLPPSPPSSSPTSSLPPLATTSTSGASSLPSPTSPPSCAVPSAGSLPSPHVSQPPHSSSCSSGFSSACSSLPRSARPSPRNSKERNTQTPVQGKIDDPGFRTRTDSGKQLTDMEILEQVTVLNLDTGERVPLSIAEDKLPQCVNPLSLHIMRLTSEYVSNSSLEKERESDEESVISQRQPPMAEDTESVNIPTKKRSQIRSIIGRTMKKTMDKAKHFAHEVRLHGGREGGGSSRDGAGRDGGSTEEGLDEQANIKLKASHKGPYEFDTVRLLQDLSGEHSGAIWCMRFSACGRLLATAGQDRVLRVWVLRDAAAYFSDMCTKYSTANANSGSHPKGSPTPSQESLVSQVSTTAADDAASMMEGEIRAGEEASSSVGGIPGPFMPRPFVTYTGHTSDLLDVSWSKNYFILSSSMDKTVRLWHISRKECLCCFQHIDFVTAIVFHPRDDRYFLSGSLDGKLRLWNIPDKKVAVWTEVEGHTKLVTAANFCQNGKFAVVGSYDGRCVFYTTEQLKYHTQIHVRSSRGRNSQGRKITGIEPMPGEDKILVTSNDSRIRLYDLRDLNLSCKYKGCVNISSQIRASFSHDGKYITSGSENQTIYVWRTYHEQAKFTSARRDRNNFWEGIKAHNAVVTCSIFAPHPTAILRQLEAAASLNLLAASNNGKNSLPTSNSVTLENLPSSSNTANAATNTGGGYILVSADFNGCIKVFLNRTKPKHSSLPASAIA